ncbi:WD repeat-containing protein 46 [Contarinia nasturtii]|uniref:WD repeat-containing protein 46 n=1 Tax=Contarinia nasturtii TaxID=265458 RepID=UPI0012D42ECD|nr:WD repeat-containing protein 46 [Contarinia nasturtii]
MNEEIEKLKTPVKKPVRYFSDVRKVESEDVEQIQVNNKKKATSFKGEVIQVREKEKFYAKSKWNNKRPENVKQYGQNKRKKSLVKIEVDPYAKDRHSRGGKSSGEGIKTAHFKEKFQRKEVYYDFANEQAARAEILLNEEEGFIEPEDGVTTAEYTQQEIVANVDITAASKHFNLSLDFGPYRMRYTKNGRHLLLGGRKGHVAAFDWITKKMHCEFNVMEEITDVTWLHVETMFAVAQKNWVHFYDNQGIEVHCVKAMNRIRCLDFLPYHFLIVSGSDTGFLSWLDVSTGTLVANYPSKLGPIRMMAHNPYNGVTCIGDSKGVVSMWSPTVAKEPLAKMLCHSTPMTALAIDPKGTFMATSGLDRHVKIWDVRTLKGPLSDFVLRNPANQLAISQRGLIAFGMGNQCEIYRKPNAVSIKAPYMRHRCPDTIANMQFVPFEDVLGVGTGKGFTSLLVPGSGEPNFDALEANPYQTKSQRKESEVHMLLDKIPAELIKLDPNVISQVDVPTLNENIEAKKSLLYLKAPTVDFKQRNKMKGKGGSVNAFKAKRIVRDQTKKQFIQSIKGVRQQLIDEHKVKTEDDNKSVGRNALDRFKAKKKK